jgi:hypothetical protein
VTWRQSEQSILVYMGADDHVYSHVPQASGEQLRVHRDSTGAIVDAIATPYFGTPTQYLPDGSMMMGMTRYASDLTVAWTADYGQDFAIPFMAANNQLFAITRAGVEVARYDGATGHLMERHENAAARGARIVWGDDAGYVLLHETGFTRYAGP